MPFKTVVPILFVHRGTK